ncbi:uncharacterized protein LOC120782498 [Bactrocera tryoni]|uniref:uncharacterized protein LOC120782498 n=1 Tax=Bactrocera tryoni TaxID=59916 RepID=UPI001A968005|nr:uncharacterized protein LOC120782498 [Bactrocera tryoni]
MSQVAAASHQPGAHNQQRSFSKSQLLFKGISLSSTSVTPDTFAQAPVYRHEAITTANGNNSQTLHNFIYRYTIQMVACCGCNHENTFQDKLFSKDTVFFHLNFVYMHMYVCLNI